MDVCVRLFSVCVVLCVGSGLAKGWSPVQGVLPTMYRLRNWKSGQGPKGCRAIERERDVVISLLVCRLISKSPITGYNGLQQQWSHLHSEYPPQCSLRYPLLPAGTFNAHCLGLNKLLVSMTRFLKRHRILQFIYTSVNESELSVISTHIVFASKQRFHPLLATEICLPHEAAGFDSLFS
jgi:hypothetical protein